MTTNPTVAIVTVTYNASSFIGNYFEGVADILEQSPLIRVVVVDNASKDDTVELAQAFSLKFPGRVTVLAMSSNLGFGKGCNVGADEAKKHETDFYWFLNPDTFPTQEALNSLVAVAASRQADFVGSQLTDGRDVPRSGAYRFPTAGTAFLSQANLGILDRLFSNATVSYPLATEARRVDWVTGASFLARASAFQMLGGFDTTYFLYFEEVDLFLRAQRSGLEVWTDPDSKVRHISGASTGINQKEGTQQAKPLPSYWYESRRHFYIKNFGKHYALLADTSVAVGRGISSARHFLRGDSPPVKGFVSTLIKQNLLSLSQRANSNRK